MIKNALSVEQILTNTQYGKKAQNGFDLSLKSVKKLIGSGLVFLDKTSVASYGVVLPEEGKYNLGQGVYSVTFNEGGTIPRGYCGWVKTRSSLVRNGCLVESGLYDTGFSCDSFGAMLFVHTSITIEQNSRIAQFLLFDAEQADLYDGQWQKERDKK